MTDLIDAPIFLTRTVPLITSYATGEPIGFYVRVVFRGEGYGLFRDGKHACVHDKDEPMVEFYDSRYPHVPVEFDVDEPRRGQFVSRYYLSTLLDDARTHIGGIALDGGVPAWTLDKASFHLALAYAQGVVAGRALAAKAPDVLLASPPCKGAAGPQLLMHDPGDEVRCRVRDGKAQALYVRRDGVPVGYGEASTIDAAARAASVNALDASGTEVRKAKAMLVSWTTATRQHPPVVVPTRSKL